MDSSPQAKYRSMDKSFHSQLLYNMMQITEISPFWIVFLLSSDHFQPGWAISNNPTTRGLESENWCCFSVFQAFLSVCLLLNHRAESFHFMEKCVVWWDFLQVEDFPTAWTCSTGFPKAVRQNCWKRLKKYLWNHRRSRRNLVGFYGTVKKWATRPAGNCLHRNRPNQFRVESFWA